MSANGRLTNGELAPIGGGYFLRRDAAAAFLAMNAAARKRWGRDITVIAAYRTLQRQRELRALYESGRGNLAAIPGTSNHGWGTAVDLTPQWSRWAVDQIGRPFGFDKRTSDAPSEWWHVKWNGSWHGGGGGARTLRQGMSGKDVVELQVYLVRGGFLHKGDRTHPKAIDGSFGPGTKSAVLHFQHVAKLGTDGVVGPATFAALRHRYQHWPK